MLVGHWSPSVSYAGAEQGAVGTLLTLTFRKRPHVSRLQ
jgi:hypothetical protein